MDDPEYLRFLRFKEFERQEAPAAALPVRELWAKFRAWLSPSTRSDWRVCLKHESLILDLEFEFQSRAIKMGDVSWEAVSTLMLDAWRDKLAGTPDRRFRHVSPATPRLSAAYRNRLLNTYQSFFTWCLDRQLVGRNPVSKAGREDETSGEREGWWSDEDFERHLPKAHPYLQKLLRVAYRCGGMRSGEVRGLSKTRSINWKARLITIRAYGSKTGRSKVIPITDDAWPILVAQEQMSPSDLLFPNPRCPLGRPLPESTLHNWIKQWRRDTGHTLLGEPIQFHSARHSFGVTSLLKGGKLPHVMDVMGISELKTARRYMRMAGDAIEPTRDMMNEQWKPSEVLGGDRRGPLAAVREQYETPSRNAPVIPRQVERK